MPLSIFIPAEPNETDRDAVLVPLRAYNHAQTGDSVFRPVAIMLHDETSAAVGGLWGRIGYDWLFVELLAVPETCRGQGLGTKLMAQAETIAADAGCIGLWLDTFSFQARGFYEKLGFRIFGTLEDHPQGQRRHFMSKRIDGDPG